MSNATKPPLKNVTSTPTTKSHQGGEVATIDWLLLIGIILAGGTSFALIRGAVETIPPAAIAVTRLWIGGLLVLTFMMTTGRRFPPLFVNEGQNRTLSPLWVGMIICGTIGNVFPFFLFPWAQQYVASGLAGIYMALMPIWTLGLAAMFAGEALTGRRLAGFCLGFVGVLILMGPSVLISANDTPILPQLALVLSTFLYAASAVLTRRITGVGPRVFTAGVLLVAAVLSTPSLLFTDLDFETWSVSSILSLVALGMIPTGLAGLMLITLIQRVGAGFMSYANYITPIIAVLLGSILFQERLPVSAFIALGVVILGLAVSQSKTSLNQADNG